MVFDLLSTLETRHYLIYDDRSLEWIKFLRRRFNNLPLLLTCRAIHDEAVPHLKTFNSIHNATLRLVTKRHTFGSAMMDALLKCAANDREPCGDSDDTRQLIAASRSRIDSLAQNIEQMKANICLACNHTQSSCCTRSRGGDLRMTRAWW